MRTAVVAYRSLSASLPLILVPLAVAASPPPEAIQPGKLYLRTGVVAVSDQPNLLVGRTAAFENRRHVIQLDGPITPERRTALIQAGVVLEDYLPTHAYIAQVKDAAPGRLAGLGFVTWVEAYADSWKIDPQIGRRELPFGTPERVELHADGKVQLVATLFAKEDAKAAATQMQALGAEIKGWSPIGDHAAVDLVMPAGEVGRLAAVPAVQFVEEAPEGVLRNDTNEWIVQSNIPGQTTVWANGIHGEGQVGGLIDGPMNEAHCSFDDSVPVGPGHRKIVAYRGTMSSDTHGTHTAGTFLGDQAPFLVNSFRDGVAFASKVSFSTLNPIFANPSTLNPRLTDAHNDGARVHSNSWGDDGTTAYTTWCQQIDQFSRDNEDSLVAFAVTNLSSLKTPENAKNVLATGASQDSPNQGNHCSGGIGPTSDGRRKPEIYAPGCGTQSASASTACGWTSLTGTSMSCPAISGGGLLVRQYYANGYYPTGAADLGDAFVPTGALIKATLINGSVNMTGIAGYPSNLEGWGRLVLDGALYFAGDVRTLVAVDVRNAQGLSTGQNATYDVQITSAVEPLRITLVWTDVPAAVNASFAAINNLDLRVTAPDGAVYRGNLFNTATGESVTGPTADDRNNLEQVHRLAPLVGTYTIEVLGTAVNQSTQGYALVVTGAVNLGPPDCNDNGIPDDQDIAGGTSADCDLDGRPDECQPDCNGNGVNDACEGLPDCNANGTPDGCDIARGDSPDCNADGTPDECQPDCNGNGVADDCEVLPDCNINNTPDACDIVFGTSEDCNNNSSPDECEGLPDCNANQVPDPCESLPDCNNNGILDACEIAAGSATDCDGDFVLDTCEPDCNTNAIADDCDLGAGSSLDCDLNGVPDECQPDCDHDGTPDACEPLVVLFQDNFEADQGWTVTSAPNTRGVWGRTDPEGTVLSGHPLQPEDDNPAGTGTLCYVTDGRAGVIPGDWDVDGGPTQLTSPPVTQGASLATLSYAYWFWSGEGTGQNDELRVLLSNDNGASWTPAATHALSATNWRTHSLPIHGVISPIGTLRVRFSVQDTNGVSFTEAAIDDVVIQAADCSVACSPPPAAILAVCSAKTHVSGACCVPVSGTIPLESSESRTGGLQELQVGFDRSLCDDAFSRGGTAVSITETTTALYPAFQPYTGPAVVTTSGAGSSLTLSFVPALADGRSYRLTLTSAVTSLAGQSVDVRVLTGDVNGDGRTDALDRSVVIGVWTGAGFTCPTDVDVSGATDALDRSVVVGVWTSGANNSP